MVKSIGSLTVSFGLVSVPVKLYSSTQSNNISFNLLDKQSGSRLKQQYVSATTGEVVEKDNIIRGYEFAKNQYVRFTPDEIKALEGETYAASIERFVPLSAVDPLYFEKTYYLAPDKGASKPYALLTAALGKLGGIGRWGHKGKAHVVMIRALGDRLAMHQLKFASEVRLPSQIPITKAKVNPSELKIARELIANGTGPFDPSSYTDDVQARLRSAVDAKVNGTPKTTAKVLDLMGALKKSLNGHAGGSRPSKPGTPNRRSSARKNGGKRKTNTLRVVPKAQAASAGDIGGGRNGAGGGG